MCVHHGQYGKLIPGKKISYFWIGNFILHAVSQTQKIIAIFCHA